MDTILADYAPDAVAADPDGIGSGYDHIRESYERTLPRHPDQPPASDRIECAGTVPGRGLP
jgi:hypothetical protein